MLKICLCIYLKRNDKRTFVQQLRPSNPAVDRDKVTTRHCGPLEARVTRVYFRRETKRNENSPQTSMRGDYRQNEMLHYAILL